MCVMQISERSDPRPRLHPGRQRHPVRADEKRRMMSVSVSTLNPALMNEAIGGLSRSCPTGRRPSAHVTRNGDGWRGRQARGSVFSISTRFRYKPLYFKVFWRLVPSDVSSASSAQLMFLKTRQIGFIRRKVLQPSQHLTGGAAPL